jgi:hypothetical protein
MRLGTIEMVTGSGSPFGTTSPEAETGALSSVEDVTSTALHLFVLHSYAGQPQLSNIRI